MLRMQIGGSMKKVLELQKLEVDKKEEAQMADHSWASGLSIRCKCGV